ncbi:MAG: CvpA family protein, partial [Methylophilus sp.]
MTIFDYLVLGIIGFSILVGLMRGAIRELFSVIGWVLAFY